VFEDGAVDVVDVTGVQGREDAMELLDALRLNVPPESSETSIREPGRLGGVALIVDERSSGWILVELFQGCLGGTRGFVVPLALVSLVAGESD
jgi:hypothetical protein